MGPGTPPGPGTPRGDQVNPRVHPQPGTPPWDQVHPQGYISPRIRYGLCVGSTHPTGMQSCFTGNCLSTGGMADTPLWADTPVPRQTPPGQTPHPIPKRQLLKRAVRLLLECVLVLIFVLATRISLDPPLALPATIPFVQITVATQVLKTWLNILLNYI